MKEMSKELEVLIARFYEKLNDHSGRVREKIKKNPASTIHFNKEMDRLNKVADFLEKAGDGLITVLQIEGELKEDYVFVTKRRKK